MPIVTVWPTPKGLPMARTTSPRRISVESPSGSGSRSVTLPWMRTTARSLRVSAPTTFPSSSRPSCKVISTWSAFSTTWAEVSTTPSALTMTPEPRLLISRSAGMSGPPRGPKNSRSIGSRSCLRCSVTFILAVKLAVTQRLFRESRHAPELLGETSRVSAESDRAFMAEMTDLLTTTIIDATAAADLRLTDAHAREVAELALALTRGLEADLSDPDRPRERLRNGVALLVAGLAAAAKPASRATIPEEVPP